MGVSWSQTIVTIVCAVIASSGFWAFLQKRQERLSAENKQITAEQKMLIGLAHDRIIELGMKYIERVYITQEEYENLHDYLFVPYEELGGNGSAKRVIDEVKKLPLHASTYTK